MLSVCSLTTYLYTNVYLIQGPTSTQDTAYYMVLYDRKKRQKSEVNESFRKKQQLTIDVKKGVDRTRDHRVNVSDPFVSCIV